MYDLQVSFSKKLLQKKFKKLARSLVWLSQRFSSFLIFGEDAYELIWPGNVQQRDVVANEFVMQA